MYRATLSFLLSIPQTQFFFGQWFEECLCQSEFWCRQNAETLFGDRIASNFETGVFSRPEVITTTSPFWAFFTSSERLVFASNMLAVIMAKVVPANLAKINCGCNQSAVVQEHPATQPV